MPPPRLSFEFDPPKAAANLRKHGVTFQEAASVFLGDPNAYCDFDEHHSDDDPRFFSIGISATGKFLFIVHNEDSGVIRIISARHASPAKVASMKSPKTKSSPAPIKPSPTAVRGKYFNQLQHGTNLVILDPALMPYFPDSELVNRALHAFLAIGDSVQAAAAPRRRSRSVASSSNSGFDPRKGVLEHAAAAGD